MVVFNAQFYQACTRAVLKHMLFILHTGMVPVAGSKLVRNFVLLMLEQLDIQVVTRVSESGERV